MATPNEYSPRILEGHLAESQAELEKLSIEERKDKITSDIKDFRDRDYLSGTSVGRSIAGDNVKELARRIKEKTPAERNRKSPAGLHLLKETIAVLDAALHARRKWLKWNMIQPGASEEQAR